MKVNQYLHDSCICIIDQAWGQDGWILAKFFFAFYQEKVKVNKNTKKKTPNIQPSSPVLVQGANQSGYRIHFILPPRRFSHDVLHTEVQYHSKVSWQSLKSRSSRFETWFSILKTFEDRVSDFESRYTMNLSFTHSKNYVPLRETRLLSFKQSSRFESKKRSLLVFC